MSVDVSMGIRGRIWWGFKSVVAKRPCQEHRSLKIQYPYFALLQVPEAIY